MSQKMSQLLIIGIIIGSFSSAFAAPAHHEYQQYEEAKEHKHIPILKQNFEQHHRAFQHSFESGNGIHVHEQGYFKESGGDKKEETFVQQGTITYHDEHGNPITLTYIADENGFQPQGAHLPTPPSIPVDIAKTMHHFQIQHEDVAPMPNYYEPQQYEAY